MAIILRLTQQVCMHLSINMFLHTLHRNNITYHGLSVFPICVDAKSTFL